MKKQFTLAGLLFFSSLLTVLGQNTTVLPGIILPQMTTAQRMAIASPENGMLVFDTDSQSYWFRQSGIWVKLSADSGNGYWQLNGLGGNEIQNINTGGFWSANTTLVPNNADNTTNPPTAPVNGLGTRLMWIPSRSAFRVGTVSSVSQYAWDANSIGLFSFAAGNSTMASGNKSTAMGYYTRSYGEASTALGNSTTADGDASTAMGFNTEAFGEVSTAIGGYSKANGDYATAMGFRTTGSGHYSTAMGNTTTASGWFSTTMGGHTTASGDYSVAMGHNTIASGHYSTAIGRLANTNFKRGSFIVGDADPYEQGESILGVDNQFVGRFANGYWLMTCGDKGNGNPSDNVRTGIRAGAGANAWSSISDSTKKERHQLIDSEGLLQKIAKFRLTTGNEKGQDPKTFRHYGPMAQDFYAAFGKDNYGSIGCDTLINQADFDGINFTAIQALVKRTDELTRINEELKSKNEDLEKRLARLEEAWVKSREVTHRPDSRKNIVTKRSVLIASNKRN